MQMKKRRGIQITAASLLYGLSCFAGYCVNYPKRFVGTRITVAVIDAVVFAGIICVFALAGRALARSVRKRESEKGNPETGKPGKGNSEKSDVGGRLCRFYESHGFLKLFLSFFLVGLVIAVSRYPGIQSGGVRYQYQQFMGMDTLVRRLSGTQYEGNFITGHHPVLLTVFFGLFIKAGVMLGHPDWGSFALSIAVCALNALGWAYVLNYFRRYMRPLYWSIAFACLFFNPMFHSFNAYILKDNLFAAALAVYCCLLHSVMANPPGKADIKALVGWSVLIPFIKNQGIYIVILCSLALFVFRKEYRKKLALCIAAPVLVYNILFCAVAMPLLRISPGGKQEMYTVFCQTTANAINQNPEIMESDLYEDLHKVFPVNKWSIYDPELSDPIKFTYNPETTREDMKKFVAAWLRLGKRYPLCYVEAMVNQTSGYYCVDIRTKDWFWYGGEIVISDADNKISGPLWDHNLNFCDFLLMAANVPRWKLFFNVAVSFWLIVAAAVAYNGKQRQLLWILPVILQWMICLLSPVNASGRYAVILYEMAPLIAAVSLNSYCGAPDADNSYREAQAADERQGEEEN